MFGSGFFRARFVRRILNVIAAVLAFLGGVLVVIASLAEGALGLLGILLGLGAILSAWWIFRGGRGLLFPRARLTFAGFVAIGVGVILFILGHGPDALLVIGGGILSWVSTLL